MIKIFYFKLFKLIFNEKRNEVISKTCTNSNDTRFGLFSITLRVSITEYLDADLISVFFPFENNGVNDLLLFSKREKPFSEYYVLYIYILCK